MKAHAEVEQIWPRDGRIRIIGRVHNLTPDPDPGPDACRLVLVLRQREDPVRTGAGRADRAKGPAGPRTGPHAGAPEESRTTDGRKEEARAQEVHAGAALDGHAFDASVPIGDLVPAHGSLTGVWDAYLVVRAGGRERRLRMGRVLDDIPDKTKVMIFPAQAVPADDRLLLVRPRYTIRNNLSVDVEWGAR
ncbi:hypothetical protein [Microtetraspora niveoalba]|uniref:hypothetical protein n=1 Tax=Microtetraspora niveoalba TaxID=46175 RepID=UPI00082ECC13|nr:hypothetical protein [Microtetraspora niveoalba]